MRKRPVKAEKNPPKHLFDRFDPPLFCKRDNGGNLNHLAVNQVLEEALVIPINSPPRMAPYNGAVEHTQGEFKSYLDRWSWKAAGAGNQALLAESAAHDLNHQPRRCLGGGTACRAYFGGSRIRYSRRKRASVYRWIQEVGGRGIGPGRRVGHHAGVLADRRPAVVGYQQTDQDREVGKSVTPFLFEKCS